MNDLGEVTFENQWRIAGNVAGMREMKGVSKVFGMEEMFSFWCLTY